MNHLFRITTEAWDAASLPEVQATCDALRTAGLYALPYDKVDVEVPIDRAVHWSSVDGGPSTLPKDNKGLYEVQTKTGDRIVRSNLGRYCILRFSNLTTVDWAPIVETIIDYRTGFRAVVPAPGKEDVDRPPEMKERSRAQIVDLLIALLATRNAIKETKHKKLAKLGIGKKRADAGYEYITTISPPLAAEALPDDEEHPPTGRTVCPHLRRAHVKGVRFGPGRQFVQPRLIQAVFVNADREWTKTRIAYNVSL